MIANIYSNNILFSQFEDACMHIVKYFIKCIELEYPLNKKRIKPHCAVYKGDRLLIRNR